jgi:hypothetical protein
MGFFGLLFWMVVIWMVIKYWHRREGRRMFGPRGSGPGGWYDSSEFYSPRRRKVERRERGNSEEQQAYIDSLERRVSELEERLDFTERLLSERRERVGQS